MEYILHVVHRKPTGGYSRAITNTQEASVNYLKSLKLKDHEFKHLLFGGRLYDAKTKRLFELILQ